MSREAAHAERLRELGRRLKRVRTLRGLTQEELSKSCKVTRAAIQQWESGQVDVKLHRIELAAQRLHCNLQFLLTGKGDPSPSTTGGAAHADDGVIAEMSVGIGGEGSQKNKQHDWWRLPPRLLKRLACKERHLRIFHVPTETMMPAINRGAYILVDFSQRELHDGQVYAIDTGISLVLKRVFVQAARRKSTTLVELVSDAELKSIKIPAAEIKIAGRVIAQLMQPF